jgi:hypothetical protein
MRTKTKPHGIPLHFNPDMTQGRLRPPILFN